MTTQRDYSYEWHNQPKEPVLFKVRKYAKQKHQEHVTNPDHVQYDIPFWADGRKINKYDYPPEVLQQYMLTGTSLWSGRFVHKVPAYEWHWYHRPNRWAYVFYTYIVVFFLACIVAMVMQNAAPGAAWVIIVAGSAGFWPFAIVVVALHANYNFKLSVGKFQPPSKYGKYGKYGSGPAQPQSTSVRDQAIQQVLSESADRGRAQLDTLLSKGIINAAEYEAALRKETA